MILLLLYNVCVQLDGFCNVANHIIACCCSDYIACKASMHMAPFSHAAKSYVLFSTGCGHAVVKCKCPSNHLYTAATVCIMLNLVVLLNRATVIREAIIKAEIKAYVRIHGTQMPAMGRWPSCENGRPADWTL